MSSEKYFCKDCNRYFEEPEVYEERHGLDSPPYQRIPICSKCGGDNFLKFDISVEKIEIAYKILPIVMLLNKFLFSLRDIFGSNIEIEDVTSSIDIICETITEMFDFMDIDMQRKLFRIDCDDKLNGILRYLEGEF